MKKFIIPFIYACVALAIACEHKDLCIHHPHKAKVRVVFDWKNAPEANPKGMCIWFYPTDGGQPIYRDLKNEGGFVELVDGSYTAICYNNDYEATRIKGSRNFDTHSFYTREGGITEGVNGTSTPSASRVKTDENSEEQRVVITPDPMWGCNAFEITVSLEDGVKYTCYPEEDEYREMEVVTKEHVITLYPLELTCTYTYEVNNVVNIEDASQMSAAISGMSGGLSLSDYELNKELVILPVEAIPDFKNNRITGKFYTFGHHEENIEPHKMAFFAWVDGAATYCSVPGSEENWVDVTSQVHQEQLEIKNKRRVHIIIDGIKVPEGPPRDPGMFEPTVDDWIDIPYDVEL